VNQSESPGIKPRGFFYSLNQQAAIVWLQPGYFLIMKTKNILFIEPEPDIAGPFGELLETEGYSVKTISNLDILLTKTSFKNYDLIIADTDNNCPMNMKLARRRGGGDIDTRLFIIACYCVLHKKDEYLRLGLDGVMAKPVDMEELVSTINIVLAEGI
jgi:DNA-binding response OmpR family regulator